MLKIDKNCWIVYNQNNTLVTIEVANRDNYKSLSKIKGYNEKSILDNEYDNADYVLRWDCQDCRTLYIFRCTHQQTHVLHTASLCQKHGICPGKRDQYIFCIRDTQNLSFQNRSKYARVRRILPQS